MLKGIWSHIFPCNKKGTKRSLAIFLGLIVLGVAYGYVSALCNRNPYYPVPAGEYSLPNEYIAKAWHWQPSPLFLPSYLLCKVPRNGFGIHETRSGFLFKSEANYSLYIRTSTILGAAIGTFIAVILVTAEKIKEKKKIAAPGK